MLMSRKPLRKDDAHATVGGSGFLKAALVRITPEGTLDQDSQFAKFLLNPSSWQESKQVNWATHNVPGQSDPVKQYVSGGARIVTFDALVTNDTSDLGTASINVSSIIAGAAVNAVSSLASSFFNVNVPSLLDTFNSISSAGETNVLDISNHLNYYRSLAYPEYTEKGELRRSPPLLALFVGKTFNTQESEFNQSLNEKTHVWILKSYNINITKQLPNLAPMEAVVSLQLEQYITTSVSFN
jgi:hypothetical protein